MLKPLLLVIGLAILGVVLAACGDDATPTSPPPQATSTPQPTATPVPPTATPVPPPATPRPTATTVPGETPLPTFTPTIRPTPTATPAATATSAAPARPGKRGGTPPASTNADIFHWGIHECNAFDNTCLAHPAPNYNGLIEYNPETDDISDIRCDLCIDWDLDDAGTTYTFRLPPNARWNNGQPVTATDVVFSLNRMVDPDKQHLKTRAIGAFYESSRVIDDNTVAVSTKFPAPAFFPILAAEYMKILSKDHVESVPDQDMKAFENIMGSGPYKVVSGEKGVKIEYVRNEDYFKEGLPYWDGIELFIITDEDRLRGAFKTRQVLLTLHSNSGIGNKDALVLAKELEGQARYLFMGPIAPLGLELNWTRDPLKDKRVRHALFLAMHRQTYVETFSSGVDLLGGPFAPNAWYGIPEDELVQIPGFRQTPDGKKHPDDIALAKTLLAEAGMSEPPPQFELLYPTIFEHPGIAAVWQSEVKETLGWDVSIRGLEIQTWIEQWVAGQFVISSMGYGVLAHDPHDFFDGLYTEDGSNNHTKWTHPRIEEIALLQARELDRVKRKALVDEATQIFLTEDSPYIFVYHTVRGHYSDLVIQNHHRVGTLSDALKSEHYWCDPECA